MIKLTRTETVGCYGTDAEGNPWATFALMGEQTVTCNECGEEITGGWQRGRLGEEAYFCSRHVFFKTSDLQAEREQLLTDIDIAWSSIHSLLDQNIVDEIQTRQLDEAYTVLKRGIDRAKERVAEIDRELESM